MSILIPSIKSEILSMLNATAGLELEAAKDKFATDIATAVYNAITSATVTIPTGAVIVTTSGSPTTQTGVNTAPAIGSLS